MFFFFFCVNCEILLNTSFYEMDDGKFTFQCNLTKVVFQIYIFIIGHSYAKTFQPTSYQKLRYSDQYTYFDTLHHSSKNIPGFIQYFCIYTSGCMFQPTSFSNQMVSFRIKCIYLSETILFNMILNKYFSTTIQYS